MEELITIEYALGDGFSGQLIAPDVEQAIGIARNIYEQSDDCDYAKVYVNGEVVYECCW